MFRFSFILGKNLSVFDRSDRVAAHDLERVAKSVAELEDAVRQAHFSVGGLTARTDLIGEDAAKLETRVRRLRFVAVGGIAVACVGALQILVTAL